MGAGGGGLAAALELANSGFDVTVLESHIYAGGCAGTFYHKKYRFDAGATLAGGFKENGPMDIIANRFDIDWKGKVDDIGIKVHLKGHPCITRRIDEKAWEKERFEQFGRSGEKFWKWQENTADLLWDLALRYPPWPPKKFKDFQRFVEYNPRHRWLFRKIGESPKISSSWTGRPEAAEIQA